MIYFVLFPILKTRKNIENPIFLNTSDFAAMDDVDNIPSKAIAPYSLQAMKQARMTTLYKYRQTKSDIYKIFKKLSCHLDIYEIFKKLSGHLNILTRLDSFSKISFMA